MKFKIFAALLCCLMLTACSASDVLTVTSVAIDGEIAGAAAAGWTQGVTYGDLALGAVSCIGNEYNTADTAAIKYIKYAACVTAAEAAAPNGQGATQIAILAGINAALNTLLIAEGASPVTPAARALAKTKGTTVHAAKVAQYDGRRPPLFVRRSVASAVKAAEAKKR